MLLMSIMSHLVCITGATINYIYLLDQVRQNANNPI